MTINLEIGRQRNREKYGRSCTGLHAKTNKILDKQMYIEAKVDPLFTPKVI